MVSGAKKNMCAHGMTPLGKAAAKGQPDIIKSLLKKGADQNAVDDHRATPLEHAVFECHDDALEVLYVNTYPMRDYPNWSILGIMSQIHPKETETSKEEKERIDMINTFQTKACHALEAFERRDHLGAQICLKEVSESVETNLLLDQACAMNELGMADLALHDAKRVLLVKPESWRAYEVKGFAHQELNDEDEAKKAFSYALELKQKSEEI